MKLCPGMRIEDVYGSNPGDIRVLHERVSRASQVLYDTWTYVNRFDDGGFTVLYMTWDRRFSETLLVSL